MNLWEQYRANQEYRKIVKDLDCSEGVPSYPNAAPGLIWKHIFTS